MSFNFLDFAIQQKKYQNTERNCLISGVPVNKIFYFPGFLIPLKIDSSRINSISLFSTQVQFTEM